MSDDLSGVSPRESAHVKARDKKTRPPKMIAVNPGLKKLALHLAERRKRPKKRA
ncbi:MAG: hypothetical protein ACHQ0J_10990 [Candidatus Dormibacterales bacterium]